MDALDRIFDNLQAGKVYGDYRPSARFPYFWNVLYKTCSNFIGYTHYGSSATKNTKDDLSWIISDIFETTPEQFEKKYTIYNVNNELGV